MAQAPWRLAECRKALEAHGLLMLQDERLPAVTTIVAGAPVKGSWWGHAEGQAIFDASQALEESGEVAAAKLIDGKVTYLHRRLWADLKAVGEAREPWQLRGLAPRAKALLLAVEKAGELRTDLAAVVSRRPAKEVAKSALELERRLLVHAEEAHTESGAHAKRLSTWARWAERAGVAGPAPTAAEARGRFEKALAALNAEHRADGRLPWVSGRLRRRRPRPR